MTAKLTILLGVVYGIAEMGENITVIVPLCFKFSLVA